MVALESRWSLSEAPGLNHFTRVWSRVKAVGQKPKKSEPLNLGTAKMWSWEPSGSCTWTSSNKPFASCRLQRKALRAALNLWSGSVENTEGKEGEVFLRRWLWWDCKWSRYFFQKVPFKSCHEFFLFLLSSWPYPPRPALSELTVNQLTSVYRAPAMHQTLCFGYSRAMSCWEFKETANQYADF